ncbi:MAG: glycosyltransferase family 2 protein, partial [Thermoflexibacteraceae bacterium]
MHLSISVVIPNYNGRDLLAQNLPSVFEALAKAQVDSEIIVADDASTDDSVAFLQTHYPEIIVVVSQQNKGFASNINAGIFKATKDLVFALNTDVRLTADYFLPLLDYFKHPNTFGVSGRVVGWDNDQLQDAAKFPVYSLKGIGGGTNYIPIDLLSTNHNHTSTKSSFIPSIFLSGSNALIDRQKLMELQGFC